MTSGHGEDKWPWRPNLLWGRAFPVESAWNSLFISKNITAAILLEQDDITCTQLGLICCRVVGDINSFSGQKKKNHTP